MSYPKVTVVGAGHVGATAAMLLLARGTADVVLLDVAEGLARGKALDMMHSRAVLGSGGTVRGTADYEESAGSDVVVVAAGLPRQPGMTRDDLLKANAGIVRSVVPRAVEASPETVLVCVTNPLDVMCYLAWCESGLAPSRVLGMGGLLDSARFAHFVSEAADVPVGEVEALVIGPHGDRMVPVPRLSTVAGRPLTEVLGEDEVADVVERTVFAGAEVVGLLESGSAYFAPGAAVAATVTAVLEDARETLPTCVLLDGEYGLRDVYLSVPAVIGAGGVVEVPEAALDADELEALRGSASSVVEGMEALGLVE